jgi:hypothetical protein
MFSRADGLIDEAEAFFQDKMPPLFSTASNKFDVLRVNSMELSPAH